MTTNSDDLKRGLKELLITGLRLQEVAPDGIADDQPIFVEGLGLDSIDILEIALVVSKRYGVDIKADTENNHQIFGSLTALAEFIAARRTK